MRCQARREQRTDDDHRGDRVGDRHQRRVQCGRDAPHARSSRTKQASDQMVRATTRGGTWPSGQRQRAFTPTWSVICWAHALEDWSIARSLGLASRASRRPPANRSSIRLRGKPSGNLSSPSAADIHESKLATVHQCMGARPGRRASPAFPSTASSREIDLQRAWSPLSADGREVKLRRLRANSDGESVRQLGHGNRLAGRDDLDAVLRTTLPRTPRYLDRLLRLLLDRRNADDPPRPGCMVLTMSSGHQHRRLAAEGRRRGGRPATVTGSLISSRRRAPPA